MQAIENPDAELLPSKAYKISYTGQAYHEVITNALKLRYDRLRQRLAAHFQGAHGLFTFDLRMGRQLGYYDFHYYPMLDFDLCTQQLTGMAVSCGTTLNMRYDVRVVDMNRSPQEHSRDYDIYPGHKAVITHIRTDGEYLATGAKNGEIKVMQFDVYKHQLAMGPKQITIQN